MDNTSYEVRISLTLPRFCRHLNNPGSGFRAEVWHDIEAKGIPVRGASPADAAPVHARVQAGGGAPRLERDAAAGGGGARARHPGRHAPAVVAPGGSPGGPPTRGCVPGHGKLMSQDEEIRRLRREVGQLTRA